MDTSLANAALRPPVLDGTNYSLWKVKMRYYIKSLDEKAWQRVINGWTSPSMTDQDGDSLPKPETDWTADEVQSSNYNSNALNAIFTSVDTNMFSLITNCTSDKSSWDTLQRHCEGSESVRRTRLRMLTSKFEMMRMEESENILEYDRRLREIANEAFSLGDPISNERLVSKVLRSLPERFNIKICAIDEAKDTTQMALEDLISSLRTFEMNIDMQKKDKGKTIAFQASNVTYNDLLQISQEVNESDLCEDSISFITKKFGDYLKRIRDKKKDAQPSKFSSFPAPERLQRLPGKQQSQPRDEGREQFNSKKYDSVQCRECKGFGHYANECANRLRKNKGYNASLSDEESDEEEKSNDEDNHTSFTALLTENHKLQVNPLGVNICKNSVCLKSTTSGNSSGDNESESDDEEITLESENTDPKAVVAKLEVILSKKDLELSKTKEELQRATETLSKFNTSTSKLESILLMGRDDKKGLGFKDSVYEIGYWYFDSGSSRHMTGSREYLVDYIEQKCGRVTYGGGAKGNIVGKGTLNVEGLPKLHNVLHVDGLTSNLISISQLCNDNSHVKFNNHACEVYDESNKCIMTGTRSSDNCYQIGEEMLCKQAQFTELELWHQKLGHVNFKTLKKLSKYEAVRGMPNISSGIPYVCGECQKGQQTRVSHPVLATSGTTRCLELLHMDLMGPMEFESFGDLKKKTAEDDNDDLLESPTILENAGVAPNVATPSATCDTEVTESEDEANNEDDTVDDGLNIPAKIQKNHPSSQIIGGIQGEVQTRKKEKVDYRKLVGLVCMSTMYSQVRFACFVSKIEPKNVEEALKDEFWINAMHDELEEFVRNDVWDLPYNASIVPLLRCKGQTKNRAKGPKKICIDDRLGITPSLK
ncbi:uncharacterized protein [Primulina huaijiensis]|uniref:uncharacterized protein n=1 Tax=Primulina huaijiensis TaxID=1492673 RepID=UPI003CC71378